ncbi:MAG: hypothetical protein HY848_04080 [Betaproteobacteria bacterium]|nr:hypothetical protein [Betaproteobacteria bacterium]
MNKILSAAFIPSTRGLVRGLRFCAAAIAVHGMLLHLSTAIRPFFSSVFDLVGEVLFWVLTVPALLLSSPFASVLWNFGLMNAPGWFAWPKPLGIALAYVVWVAVLFGLAQVVQHWSNKK